ncbi:MAG: polyphosphate kinase 2 family protein [Gammaproteobacteria bacterium]|nr:polyphosphate kinase 2 family protein [Gammaproteobacteria bacterium]
MRIDIEEFLALKGKLRLKDWPTRVRDYYTGEDDARRQLAAQVEKLAEMQNALYAADSWSLLLIFQAMDAAGKDGAIKHVMSGVNPQGCQVFSFKHPSVMELDHDFLWRTTQCLPERGRIGIFNRSYYEEVLVVRVHPQILASQRLPNAVVEHGHIWRERYDSIRDFEAHLHRNGTQVVKFFLHVSKEEQRRRFLERIDDPAKNWKFSLEDVKERAFWKDYRRAYEEAIAATSTKDSPWYVVPADDKRNARLIISRVIVETLQGLRLRMPKLDAARRRELKAARAQLESERAQRGG